MDPCTLSQDGGLQTTLGLMRGGGVTSPSGKVSWSSAAAEFGQEERHAEEDPHHQQAGAERQQGERVQEAGVQAQVAHRQQAAQVLLDHGLPGTDAAEGTGRRRCGGGRGRQPIRRSGRGGGERHGGSPSKQMACNRCGWRGGMANKIQGGDITTMMLIS